MGGVPKVPRDWLRNGMNKDNSTDSPMQARHHTNSPGMWPKRFVRSRSITAGMLLPHLKVEEACGFRGTKGKASGEHEGSGRYRSPTKESMPAWDSTKDIAMIHHRSRAMPVAPAPPGSEARGRTGGRMPIDLTRSGEAHWYGAALQPYMQCMRIEVRPKIDIEMTLSSLLSTEECDLGLLLPMRGSGRSPDQQTPQNSCAGSPWPC